MGSEETQRSKDNPLHTDCCSAGMGQVRSLCVSPALRWHCCCCWPELAQAKPYESLADGDKGQPCLLNTGTSILTSLGCTSVHAHIMCNGSACSKEIFCIILIFVYVLSKPADNVIFYLCRVLRNTV